MTVELPDDQAAALIAKAAAAGMTLEDWLKRLSGVEEKAPSSQPLAQIAKVILDNMQDVPRDVVATAPKDGASQHDHYIYGWPKRDV
jgi:hypothetical protein